MKPSIPLLSRLARRRFVITRSYIPTSSPSYSSPLSPGQDLKPYSKTHGLTPQTNQFPAIPSRNLNTLVKKQAQISSRQRKIKEKSDLEEAFESAETIEEMLKAFTNMEASFDENELGLATLKLGLKINREGEDPEKALFFAIRALNALEKDDGKPNLPVAMALQLLGSVNCSLKRCSDSLGYLNRANKLLLSLEKEGVSDEDIRPVLHAVHFELANCKTAMGRREEAIGNYKKCMEIKELMLGKDSKELGVVYRRMAECYVAVLDFKEALPYALKALEIHERELGENSGEVGQDRRLLGVIYTGMENHEKALEQNVMSKKVLKSSGLSSELLRAEIDAVNMQIASGRYDEAISSLKGVVNHTEKDSLLRALVHISMAKVLCNQEKFPDSKKCLAIAYEILEKKEMDSPVEVAEAYVEISMEYENMNEYETAISLLKRSLALLERQHQEQDSEATIFARIGLLLVFTGKVQEGIPYLENAAEILKETYGPKHYGIGNIYNNLGMAYLELDKPQSAAQVFALAKDIMDVSLGPKHADSINACENLSKAYSAMGSYTLAMKSQQQVIDAWESLGPRAKDELRKAKRFLQELEKKAHGAFPDKVSAGQTLQLPWANFPSTSSPPSVEVNQK